MQRRSREEILIVAAPGVFAVLWVSLGAIWLLSFHDPAFGGDARHESVLISRRR